MKIINLHTCTFLQVLLLLPAFVWAQQNCTQRYLGKTFNSIQVFRDVVYTQNAPKLIAASLGTETTINRDLKMDIFMPPPTDQAVKRPVVIVAHGGGFVDVAFMGGTLLVGTKDNEDVQALCDTLAHWGFVTACIEYRTGFDAASNTSLKRAVWRGAQDMSAAIRFFRKNATWFDIDPERIFIGGSSAGAFCCIHSTFIDNSERIPESFQITPFVMLDLGALHSRPVVELTGFNPFTGNNVTANDVDSLPKAVAGYWGAIADTNMFNGNNKAPMIMFHGDSDPIVSSTCAQPFSGVILVAPVTCGSEIMDIALNNRNMPHSTTIQPGESHEYWGALNGAWMSSGPNAYWVPIIDSTTHFFYRLMQPQTPNINGPSLAYPNTIYTYNVSNPVATSEYCWEITGGTIVSPTTNGSSVDVLFYNTTTQGIVKCSEIDQAEVASLQAAKTVNITAPVAVSYQNNHSDFDFHYYPNPNNGQLNLEFPLTCAISSEKIINVELFDILGRKTFSVQAASHQLQLDLSQFPTGVYALRAEYAGVVVSKQLIIR